jgi:hypothetical protein
MSSVLNARQLASLLERFRTEQTTKTSAMFVVDTCADVCSNGDGLTGLVV